MGYMTAATTGVILTSGNTVFNEASADKDFRIESDDNTHMLFVDAGNDRVGIGTSTPLTTVDIEDGLTTVGAVLTLSTKEPTVVDGDVIGRLNFRAPLETGADALLLLASIHAEADATFDATTNSTDLVFSTAAGDAAAERARITSDGKVGIGTAGPSSSVEIQDGLTTTGAVLTLSTKEPTVVDEDVIGQINFRAPLETGTDALLLLASISAVANEAFDADQNQTELVLSTASGAAAAERVRITHDGDVQVAGLTASEIVITDSNKGLTSAAVGTYPSLTELIHVKGVTSGIQTQLDAVAANAITAVEGEATLLLAGQVNLRAGVEVCTSDPAPAIAESGTVYQFTKGSAGVFTLPVNPTVGVQYVLVNGTANDIVITRPASGYKINGATSNVTNTTQWAATSIVCVVAGSSGEWLVFGGI